nr:aromatic ring-hydroxylating dioxygenase subunit alpha [Pseudomonadota bacterium]
MKNSHPFQQEATYQATRETTERAVSITPEAYTNPEFFEIEKKQVFQRNWVSAGPADRVKNPGDIMIAEVGGQSI